MGLFSRQKKKDENVSDNIKKCCAVIDKQVSILKKYLEEVLKVNHKKAFKYGVELDCLMYAIHTTPVTDLLKKITLIVLKC